MIKPAIKHSLEFAAGVIAVFVLLIGFLGWQLSKGPLSLELVAPNIQDVLNSSLGGNQVEFSSSYLKLAQSLDALDVEVRDAKVRNASGDLIAEFPEIDLRFTLSAMLRGVIAPSRVSIFGASALLTRDAQGKFGLGLNQQTLPEERSADQEEKAEEGEGSNPLEDIYTSFIEPDESAGELIYLSEFVLQEGELTFIDEQTGGAWYAMGATLSFQRTINGVAAALEAALQVADGEALISLSGSFDRGTRKVRMRADVEDILISELAADSGEALSAFQRIQIPIKGSTSFTVTSQGRVEEFDLMVASGKGVVDLSGLSMKKEKKVPDPIEPNQPWAYEVGGKYESVDRDPPMMEEMSVDDFTLEVAMEEPGRFSIKQFSLNSPDNRFDFVGGIGVEHDEETGALTRATLDIKGADTVAYMPGVLGDPLALDSLNLSLSYEHDDFDFTLEDLSFSAYGAEGKFSGTINELFNDTDGLLPSIDLTGKVKNLAAKDLINFWPEYLGMGGRDWVIENVMDGRVTDATLSLKVPPREPGEKLPPDALQANFTVAGGVVQYLKGMTLARNVSANGTLFTNSLRIKINRGKVGNLDFSDGVVWIPRLEPKGAVAEFTGTVDGNTQEILELIDMEPLKLTRKFGIKPEDVGGQARGSFKVTRPMRSKVPNYAVGYEVSADTRNLTLPDIFGDLSFTNGAVHLDIDEVGVKAKGTMDLAGVPSQLEWTEVFEPGEKPSTEYLVTINAPAKDYAKLGYPLGGIAKGPLRTVVRTVGNGMDVDIAYINSDFSRAVMDIPAFHYFKDVKAPANVAFNVTFDDKGVRYFRNIKAKGEGLDVIGDMKLADNLQLLDANFPTFVMGDDMNFALQAHRDEDTDRLTLDVTGERFDAGTIVYDYLLGESSEAEATPLTISGEVDRVRLNQDVYLNDAKMVLSTDRVQLTELEVDATLDGDGAIYAALAGPRDERKQLVVSSSSAHAVVGGLYDVASITGGQFDMSMYIDPPSLITPEGDQTAEGDASPSVEPEYEPGLMYGEIFLKDFRVVDLPLLARLLSAAGSLSGLGDLLNGEGLSFNNMKIPFVMSPEKIDFKDVQATGASLGVTMTGIYHRPPEEMEFGGTLVPAYSVNRVLGKVPLLGDLLISRKGEGLLGFTYSINGPLDEARIFVNPLSALAPGFLRRLFQLGGPDVSEPPAPPAPEKLPDMDQSETDISNGDDEITVKQEKISEPAKTDNQ